MSPEIKENGRDPHGPFIMNRMGVRNFCKWEHCGEKKGEKENRETNCAESLGIKKQLGGGDPVQFGGRKKGLAWEERRKSIRLRHDSRKQSL